MIFMQCTLPAACSELLSFLFFFPSLFHFSLLTSPGTRTLPLPSHWGVNRAFSNLVLSAAGRGKKKQWERIPMETWNGSRDEETRKSEKRRNTVPGSLGGFSPFGRHLHLLRWKAMILHCYHGGSLNKIVRATYTRISADKSLNSLIIYYQTMTRFLLATDD